MNAILEKIKQRRQLSLSAQLLAAAMACVMAVALPQICHLIGSAAGLGTSVGIALLPMHLPVLLVGLLAGPVAGAAAGALSPILSTLLTGMPLLLNLPLMIAELTVYGLVAGLLRSARIPTVLKVLAAQLCGRLVYLGATAIAILAFAREELSIAAAFGSFKLGLLGIALQLVLLPLLVFRLENAKKK